MSVENRVSLLARNARYFWLGPLLLLPSVAWLVYDVTPHEEIWHEILYSLFCLPIFGLWLVALIGCLVAFLMHRSFADR